MSAENEFQAFLMENGEYWLCSVATGDTFLEAQGSAGVLAKCASYEEAQVQAAEILGEDGHYFEHGGELYEKEYYESRPAHFLESVVYVLYPRKCGCLDYRDLAKERWRVVERSAADWRAAERVLGKDLSYAMALTLANCHANEEPGQCRVEAPRFFRKFARYPRHNCDKDYWLLLPWLSSSLLAD